MLLADLPVIRQAADCDVPLTMLQMAILDGKEYASLQDGRDNTEEEVTKCILLLNNQVGSVCRLCVLC